MGSLLRLLAARNALLLGASVAVSAGFQVLICAIVTALDLDSLLQQVMTTAPPFFSALIGEQFTELTAAGVLAFGWNHPVIHAVGTALAIVLGARAVAGEIDQGAAELLLTQPVSRGTFYAAHVLFAVLALALLAVAGAGGTVLGTHLFDIARFSPRDLTAAAFNFWLLQLAWFAIALALSSRGREGGRVATTAFFIALISYLIAAIGSVWEPASSLLPLSLHHYYDPQEVLVRHTLSGISVLVLAAVSVAFIAAGALGFARRDIP